MPAAPPANPRLRRAAGRLVRKAAGGRLTSWQRQRLQPELSVVMPVYNVEAYLREALDSVLGQSLANLELIAVDDGSTDGCLAILREYERNDPRVLVLTQANAGQGVARNVGVGHARAEFLTFMDSDDTIPAGAFAHLVEVLRGSGSDFAIGGVRRFRHGRYRPTNWQRTVHQADRIGTTITEFPAAMQDIIACNRVFRTAFWRERVGDFRGGIAYEDHVPMLAAYVRAERFDVLNRITYNWRIREDDSSTGQQKAKVKNLLDRIEVKEEARQLLLAEASPFVHDVWVARCLDIDFGPFIAQALDADDEYRDVLAEAYRTFCERASETAWDLVRVFAKVRAHLVAQARWADVDAATQYFASVRQMPPTVVLDGVLVASLPTSEPWAADLPTHLLRMAPADSHFEGVVQHLAWHDDEAVITGWMRHRGLDLTSPPALTLRLRSGDREVALAVEPLPMPEADLWSPLPYAGTAAGGFRARVPLDQLAGSGGHLVGSLTYEGLVSEGGFYFSLPGSSAAGTHTQGAVTAYWDTAHGFGFRLGSAEPDAPVPVGPLLASIDLAPGEIVVGFDRSASLAGLALSGDAAGLSVVAVNEDHVGFSARPGTFDLTLTGRPVHPSPAFAETLPFRLRDEAFTAQVSSGRRGIQVRLTAPYADDELGRYHQQRLADRYRAQVRAGLPELRDSVLLTNGPTQLALTEELAEELARTRPELDRIWGVRNTTDVVPQGARAVLIDSTAWYDAVASSRFLITDEDVTGWYERRPEQVFLQTFAPTSKNVGIALWRARGLSPGLIRHATARANAAWDLVLAASAEDEATYREQFAYTGPVLVAGPEQTDLILATLLDPTTPWRNS